MSAAHREAHRLAIAATLGRPVSADDLRRLALMMDDLLSRVCRLEGLPPPPDHIPDLGGNVVSLLDHQHRRKS